MDRRHEAFKQLNAQGLSFEAAQEAIKAREHAPSAVMIEGKQTEFWQAVTAEINRQIRIEELRFLDRLATTYEAYLQAYSRRQALIAALAIPETAKGEGW